MLTITILRGFGQKPIVVQGSTIIVEDENGTPVALVDQNQLNPEVSAITVGSAADDRFNDMLSSLGIDKVVVNEPIELPLQQPEGAQLLMSPKGLGESDLG